MKAFSSRMRLTDYKEVSTAYLPKSPFKPFSTESVTLFFFSSRGGAAGASVRFPLQKLLPNLLPYNLHYS